VRSRLLAAPLLASGLLLAGCGTGLQATTYTKERAPRDFDNKQLGDIAVRNLGIAPPPSGSSYSPTDTAVLSGGIVNIGDSDDALVAVETPAAGTAMLQAAGATTQSVPIPARSDAGDWSVQLSDLKGELVVGHYVEVTLVFQKAGRLEGLQVPVRIGDTGLDHREANQDPYHSDE
jgi:copper(I)-binding protein